MAHLSEELIHEYLDQMLNKTTQQKAESHLANCEECSAQVGEFQALFSVLDEVPEISLTHDLTPAILGHLPKPSKIPVLWKEPAFLIQASLTVILLTLAIPLFKEEIIKSKSILLFSNTQSAISTEMLKKLTSLFIWHFDFSFTPPTLPTIPYSPNANLILTLGLLVGIMWITSNIFLLRKNPAIQK